MQNGGDAYEEVEKSDVPAPSAGGGTGAELLLGKTEGTDKAVWFSKEGVSGNDNGARDVTKVEELHIPSSSILAEGSTTTLNVTADPEDAEDISVEWKVEESDVVSVDETAR